MKKRKEEEAMYPCEVCGKQTLGHKNFHICDECFDKPQVQKALFRI
jgi:hypothetical protein